MSTVTWESILACANSPVFVRWISAGTTATLEKISQESEIYVNALENLKGKYGEKLVNFTTFKTNTKDKNEKEFLEIIKLESKIVSENEGAFLKFDSYVA
ncbi:MAG: hypothetical protein LBH37_01380 [Oscillospiraceae bacterium]|jgi:hypothetical protein|nr:hypothetical protein [Oscillospiraceae bacterium]